MSQVIQKAVKLLRLFSMEKPEWRLKDLSARAKLNPSTVHRILKSLIEADFIKQDPISRKYRLGPGLLELGGNVIERLGIVEAGRPALRRLADACRETAYVSIMIDNHVLFVDIVESPQTVRLTASIGQRLPAHSTASGKMFLASLSEEGLSEFLREPLTSYTSKTITDPDRLRAELREISRQGYAVAREEHEPDTAAVAAPIRSPNGQVRYVVTLSGPSFRLTPSAISQLVGPLLAAADEIASALNGGW